MLLKVGKVQLDDNEVEHKLFKFMFNFYDADGSGGIDRSELRSLFHDIGVIKGKTELMNLTEDAVTDVIEELDDNGSGLIEFDEFWRWVTEHGFKEEFLASPAPSRSGSSSDSDSE